MNRSLSYTTRQFRSLDIHPHRYSDSAETAYNSIPKQVVLDTFKAIADSDQLALLNIYHELKDSNFTQHSIRRWLTYNAKNQSHTTLIHACTIGNLEIVKFIVDVMFLGLSEENSPESSESEIFENKPIRRNNILRRNSKSFPTSIIQEPLDEMDEIPYILSNLNINGLETSDSDPEETELPASPRLLRQNPDNHYLLTEFLETQGTIQCDDDQIEGASALWAAASFGYHDICKFLIEKGAWVHTRTVAGSTPLRCACFDGHLETVKLLVEN